MTTIRFYRERDEPYGVFSNFSKHSFEVDGQPWQTVEHYFQAMKFQGTPQEYAVQSAKSPMEAKTLGNDRGQAIRPDWEEMKDSVMRHSVRAKFEQNLDIRATLLGTGDAYLIEDAYNDSYWGCGLDDTGKNRLGEILMEVRKQLRQQYDRNSIS